ncbi:MAG: hypothetical protein JXA10_15280 [Anaerolineae bacterium]|nr:hypothetical protein [Anaerolineae bacterium]
MKRRIGWLLLVLLLGMLLAACGGDDDKDDGGNGGGNGEDASPETADLIVAAIDVDPMRPAVGQPFHIRVTIKNQGKTEAGAFSITVDLRDVTREDVVSLGSFDGEPLKAGAEVTLYEGDYPGLENTGSYQVQVAISYNADSNTDNNEQHQAFTVVAE